MLKELTRLPALCRNGQMNENAPTGTPHKWSNLAGARRICLECAAIFRHLPLTIRCRLLAIQGRGYTRAMMTKRILTICAAVSAVLAVEAAVTSLASAQGYPPPGTVYAPSPQPYPGYPADYR